MFLNMNIALLTLFFTSFCIAGNALDLGALTRAARLSGPRSQHESTREDFQAEREVAKTQEKKAADLVTLLPGVGKPTSNIYSGYVTVDEEAGRALFYASVESSGNPDEDPLVLWLNGGPGCSSLAGGFLSELGPYYPTSDGRLQENKNAWTKVANIIFLESPAFVGWSYSNTTEDRVVGDARTAKDALAFLLGYFDRFPEYKGRKFYLAGESYGGHYVPNLALAILKHNEQQAEEDAINLQGFLVGNAWTDPSIDNEGAIDFWYSHAIISQDTANSLKKSCNFSDVGPLMDADQAAPSASLDPEKCREVLERSSADFLGINIYDVYADICLPHAEAVVAQMAANSPTLPLSLGAYIHAQNARTQHSASLAGNEVVPYDACVDDEVTAYFNRPEVQHALHANTSGSLPGPWAGCSRYVDYSRKDLFSSMLPVYAQLLTKKLRILVFSGDVDGIVPVTGSRRWIQKLGLDIEKPWRTWHSSTGQVGGHVVEHNEYFSFATVRNAGHMVPYTQGERSFHLFRHYLSNKHLD